MIPPVPSEDSLDREFIELLTYWRRKAPPDGLPGRQHVDPIELPARLLPNIVLLDVERHGHAPRFRFRLVGTALFGYFGREVTGARYEEAVTAYTTASVRRAMETVVAEGHPVYLETPVTAADSEFIRVKRLGLPLARDGRTVDMILGMVVPVRRPPGHAGNDEPEVMIALDR